MERSGDDEKGEEACGGQLLSKDEQVVVMDFEKGVGALDEVADKKVS